MQHIIEEKKSYQFPTIIKGLYFLEERKEEGKECTIININLNGEGLELYTLESVSVNTKLFLEMFPPSAKEAVTVEGIIRWTKKGRKDCVCGIKLTERLDSYKMEMLGM